MAKPEVKLFELGLIRQLQMGPDGGSGEGALTTKCIRERNIFYFAGDTKYDKSYLTLLLIAHLHPLGCDAQKVLTSIKQSFAFLERRN